MAMGDIMSYFQIIIGIVQGVVLIIMGCAIVFLAETKDNDKDK